MTPYDDCPGENQYDVEYLRAALKDRSTDRGDWEKIDCCLTGKDADLQPWGQQGIEVVRSDGDKAYFVAHILKTFVGNDACLNLPPEIESNEGAYDQAKEAYLEQAELVVQGCDVAGEWDGDDWVMFEKVPFEADWLVKDDQPDYEGMADAAMEAAEKVLAPIVEELKFVDDILNDLSGWTERENRCPAGQPGQYAAWRNDE